MSCLIITKRLIAKFASLRLYFKEELEEKKIGVGLFMKQRKGKTTMILIGGVFVAATIADLKYKGLLYRQLSKKMQAYVDQIIV